MSKFFNNNTTNTNNNNYRTNNYSSNNYGKVNRWNNQGLPSRMSNKENKDVEKKSHPANIFLILLLVITFAVMFFHVVSVIKYNSSLNKEKTKEQEPTNIVDTQNETKEKEEKNQKELTKLCKLIDDDGAYKYEEYVKYLGTLDSNLSDAEKYKAMSKKTYCYQWMCIKIEEEGIINYVECDTGDYIRVSFEEYQDLQKEQNRAKEALNNACENVGEDGSFDSGAATGLRVTCNNYICSLNYDGEIVTKNCKK